EAGRAACFSGPVVMKKSRPGVPLRVLADPADRDRLATIVFAETPTIGLRYSTARRIVLPREERRVETPYGSVRVKVARAPDGTANGAPEYGDSRALGRSQSRTLKARP